MKNGMVLRYAIAGVIFSLVIINHGILSGSERGMSIQERHEKNSGTIYKEAGADQIYDISKCDFHFAEAGAGIRDTAPSVYQAWVTLTVSESKRLIAKGLLRYPPFKERLEKGQVIITKGTTNTYIVEELLNETLRPGEFVIGHILPARGDLKLDRSNPRRELVMKDGMVRDISLTEALEDMNEGDIILKGANIINYRNKQAGVMVGSPTGGTTGAITPVIKDRNLRLIIPVGLEKESGQDIEMLSRHSIIPHEAIGDRMPRIWSIEGELFTELEAIKQFADVEVVHMASGGIGGAEGAVTICIRGLKGEVEKAVEAVEAVQGEAGFLR